MTAADRKLLAAHRRRLATTDRLLRASRGLAVRSGVRAGGRDFGNSNRNMLVIE